MLICTCHQGVQISSEPVWNLITGIRWITTGVKNLFVICVAYWSTYLPVLLRLMLMGAGMTIPDAVQFAMMWIYISSPAVNGSLYIALHSSVKRELRRYLPRCRRPTVAVASTHPVGNGGCQRCRACVNTEAGAARAPVPVMPPQRATVRLPTTVL